MIKHSTEYFHGHGVRYDSSKMHYVCSPNLPVLEFLKGKPWGNLALACVTSLRPSMIRVLTPDMAEKCDSVPWRVTVYLSEGHLVRSVYQEVYVEVCEPTCGSELCEKLGINE